MTNSKASANKSRLPQRRRARREALPTFRITARDAVVIESVHQHRALTTQQISDLWFAPVDILQTPAPSSRCLHRLKLLFQFGYLRRTELPHLMAAGRMPFIYQLDEVGARFLAQRYQCSVEDLDWRPREQLSHLFLEHLLAINTVRVATARSAHRHGFELVEWQDEKRLSAVQTETVTLTSPSGRTLRAAVVPDGYFHLIAGQHHYHQFLEVDRSTVTGSSPTWGRRTWARKVLAYLAYYASGQYHARFHSKSMRVLTVTIGEKRLENLLKITETQGGQYRFWFTTLKAIEQADVLVDPIWRIATREGLHKLTW